MTNPFKPLLLLVFTCFFSYISAQLPTTGLVAWYPFNGNSNDESGNGNNGTIYGAISAPDRFGNLNSAFSYDGVNDYIEIGNTSTLSFPGQIFSISFWMKGDAIHDHGILAKRNPDASSSNWEYSISSTYDTDVSKLGLTAWSSGGETVYGISGTQYTYRVNSWDHWVFTADGTNTKAYRNGILLSIVPRYSGFTMDNSGGILRFGTAGAIGHTSYMKGKLDDIRIYNRALDESEIHLLFAENDWPATASISDADGNIYEVAKIGTQIWMKQNLKTTKFSDGTPIPNVTVDATWAALTTPAYSWYSNDAVSNKATYGGLYNWYAINTGKLCPTGWHVPSDEEWKKLEIFLGMSPAEADRYDAWRGTTEGGELKLAGTSFWNTPNTGATNSSGFSALPGGQRSGAGTFMEINVGAHWHTSTQSGGDNYRRSLYYSEAKINRYSTWKSCGYSVRCVKDDLNSGLVAYYPFNGNANDESGNGNNGTISGTTPANDRFGNPGKAYSFNGTNNYIEASSLVSALGSLLTGSISMWFKAIGPNSSVKPLLYLNPWGLTLGESASNLTNESIYFENNPIQAAYSNGNGYYFDNSWHHVVVVVGQTENSIYLDGTKLSLTYGRGNSTSGNNFLQGLTKFQIGASLTYSYFFNGVLDDIRIYNRAINDSEIQLLYVENGWDLHPQISSFNPSSGAVGSTVTITGSNFDPVPANNIVWFGAAKASVISASLTQLEVTVPNGASHQPISVTTKTKGLTGYSSNPYFVTFNSPKIIDATSFASKVDFVTGSNPYFSSVCDIDGDGKLDLIVTNASANTLSVYRNIVSSGTIGSGSFATKVDFSTGANPLGVAIKDIDGDGKPDIVVSNANSNSVSVFRNLSTPGTFTAASLSSKIDFGTGTTPFGICIMDFDLDGKNDIAVTNSGSNTISIFRNTSSVGTIDANSFSAKCDLITGLYPDGITCNDFDNDGKPDLAVVNYNGNTISIFKNISTPGNLISGSFSSKIDFNSGTAPWGIASADIDGDGKNDIIVTNRGSNTISLFKNVCTPGSITTSSFESKIDFATGINPQGISISNLVGDLKPDIVVSNIGSSTVSVFRNKSTSGSFTTVSLNAKVDFSSGNGPEVVSLGDFDGDSRTDIAALNYFGNSLSIFQNVIPVLPSSPIIGTITQPTCTVSTGSIVVNGLPATGTWTLTRTPGAVTTTGTGTNTTITGLPAGTYSFTVTNSLALTSVSSADAVINSQPSTPTAPVVGTITNPTCSTSTGGVTLGGLPASGTWIITRSPGGNTTSGTGTSATITSLAPGTYSFTVTNAYSCTSPNTSSITINPQPETPPAPLISNITQPTCSVSIGSISLSGLPVAGTWTLTRSPGGTTITGTGTSTIISGLTQGTYTFTVSDASCTSLSSAAAVINPPPGIPAAPALGTATQPTCLAPTGSINISGLPSSGSWSLINNLGETTTGTGTTTTISGLVPCTYYFTVRNSSGCISAATGNVIINPIPVGFVPVIVKKWNDVLICSNINNKFNNYQWYRGTTPVTGVTQEQFFWTKNGPGAYQVLTTDKDGCKNFSNVIQVDAGSGSFGAYPNPANKNVIITLNDVPIGKAVISIFNSQGLKVYETETGNEYNDFTHELSIETLQAGLYYIRVTIDNGHVYNTKIIVEK
ncbi:MAG TPA: FISUMP domain-containing protein [Bacteroidales bacterium]|nr:FISUMP domain-containing protein [Bacteroidales bacterium]